MDMLIIRLDAQAILLPLVDLKVEWGLLREGELIAGPYRTPLADIQPTLNTDGSLHAWVLIPSESVLLTQVSVPSQKVKHIARAVPYLLEDQLTEDVDELHFAILGKSDSAGSASSNRSVAVINRQLLTDWLAQFHELSIHVTCMVPDVLTIPQQPLHWYLILQRQRTLLRTGLYQGLAFPGTQMPVFLDTLFEQVSTLPQPIQIQLIHDINEPAAGRILDALKREIESTESASLFTVNRQHIDSSCFEVMAKTLFNQQLEKTQPNVLQGAFKTKAPRLQLRVNPLPLAACLVLFLVLQLGAWAGQAWYFNQRANTLEQQAMTFYRQQFPNAPAGGVMMKKSLQKLLNAPAASPSSGFMSLLQVMGQQMQPLTQGNPQKMQIRRLTYEDKKSSLQVDLSAENFDLLNEFKTLIEKTGNKATLEGASQDKDKVKAHLILST